MLRIDKKINENGAFEIKQEKNTAQRQERTFLFFFLMYAVVQFVIFYNRYVNVTNFELNAYLVCLFVFILVLDVLTWGAHHKNVRRLFAGEEHKTSAKKK